MKNLKLTLWLAMTTAMILATSAYALPTVRSEGRPASLTAFDTSTPTKTATDLYKYYLNGFPEVRKHRTKFATYLSARFLREVIRITDADMLLDAQDFDETWKNHFRVHDQSINGNRATVKVSLNGKSLKYVLQLKLVKENGAWKVDGVKGVES